MLFQDRLFSFLLSESQLLVANLQGAVEMRNCVVIQKIRQLRMSHSCPLNLHRAREGNAAPAKANVRQETL